MAIRTKSLSAERELWESYRLHQRDVLLECAADAEMIVKRAKGTLDASDRSVVLSLLWEKRCQPWKFFRDEQRALAAIRR